MDQKTLTLPSFAQAHIREMQAQMQSLQAQLQQFVDGCVCGMGLDMTAKLSVDLDTMTVSIPSEDTGEETP